MITKQDLDLMVIFNCDKQEDHLKVIKEENTQSKRGEEIKNSQEKFYQVYYYDILYKIMDALSQDYIFLLKHQNIHP